MWIIYICIAITLSIHGVLPSCPPLCSCVDTKVNCGSKALKEVPKVPKNTTELYLQNNQISNLPKGIFDGLTSLVKLNIENNQIQCTCEYLTLLQTTKTKLSMSMVKANCMLNNVVKDVSKLTCADIPGMLVALVAEPTRTIHAVGCFDQYSLNLSPSTPKQLLVNDRNLIVWNNAEKFKSFAKTLINKCTQLAVKGGYNYFGIVDWGECWGVKSVENGKTANTCKKGDATWKVCDGSNGENCLGIKDVAYVYSILKKSAAATVPAVVTTPAVLTTVPAVLTTVPAVITTVPAVVITTVPAVVTTAPAVVTTVPAIVINKVPTPGINNTTNWRTAFAVVIPILCLIIVALIVAIIYLSRRRGKLDLSKDVVQPSSQCMHQCSEPHTEYFRLTEDDGCARAPTSETTRLQPLENGEKKNEEKDGYQTFVTPKSPPCEIAFLEDGREGTNGEAYQTFVTPTDELRMAEVVFLEGDRQFSNGEA